MILKNINIKSKIVLSIFAALSLFIFLDGYYLIWFNSLYGEPMMITSLMMFIGSCLFYIKKQYTQKSEKGVLLRINLLLISGLFFLGSKMQVLPALPIILLIMIKVIIDNKKLLSIRKKILYSILILYMVIYPISNNILFTDKNTQYNAVFYGILKDAKKPIQDLKDLGLSTDMALDAGKHAYMNKEDYVKYNPKEEITKNEFFNKMNNFKLVKFYLTHPTNLFTKMDFTAKNAFLTSTSFGKYSRNDNPTSITEFNRFTLWSEIRESKLPKNLIFILLSYLLFLSVSTFYFIINRKKRALRAKIILLWSLMFIGGIQFPMAYVGNGEADLSKHLYLFNFTFDILILVAICWVFHIFVQGVPLLFKTFHPKPKPLS